MSEKQQNKTKKRAEQGKDVELYEYDLDNIILKDDRGQYLWVSSFIFVNLLSELGGKWTSKHKNGLLLQLSRYYRCQYFTCWRNRLGA